MTEEIGAGGSPVSELPPVGQAAPSAVWPPPPVGLPEYENASVLPHARIGYTPLRRLCKVYSVLLSCGIVLDAAMTFLEERPGSGSVIAAGLVALLELPVLAITCFLFLRWTYLAYKNLVAFGTRGLSYTPGFAVGYFFIPILNIYKPIQVFSEIWKASDPAYVDNSSEWRKTRIAAMIPCWWLTWIVWDTISAMNAQPQLGNDQTGSVAALVFFALSSLLAMIMVQGITARQDVKLRAFAP
jgi:hypothetical protein